MHNFTYFYFRLVSYVLEGESEKLKVKSSEDDEVQDFIDSVSLFQVSFSKVTTCSNNSNSQFKEVFMFQVSLLKFHLQLHSEYQKFWFIWEPSSVTYQFQ